MEVQMTHIRVTQPKTKQIGQQAPYRTAKEVQDLEATSLILRRIRSTARTAEDFQQVQQALVAIESLLPSWKRQALATRDDFAPQANV
jgi:hypothetical protein